MSITIKLSYHCGFLWCFCWILFFLKSYMMTSSNGNIFRVTGPLCGEFTGPGEFPTQRPVTRSFDVSFDLRLNKRLSKQPRGWWFETPSWSFWRHCNDMVGCPSVIQLITEKIFLLRKSADRWLLANVSIQFTQTIGVPVIEVYRRSVSNQIEAFSRSILLIFSLAQRPENGLHLLIFSNAFSWTKISEILWRCHWNMFPVVYWWLKVTISLRVICFNNLVKFCIYMKQP